MKENCRSLLVQIGFREIKLLTMLATTFEIDAIFDLFTSGMKSWREGIVSNIFFPRSNFVSMKTAFFFHFLLLLICDCAFALNDFVGQEMFIMRKYRATLVERTYTIPKLTYSQTELMCRLITKERRNACRTKKWPIPTIHYFRKEGRGTRRYQSLNVFLVLLIFHLPPVSLSTLTELRLIDTIKNPIVDFTLLFCFIPNFPSGNVYLYIEEYVCICFEEHLALWVQETWSIRSLSHIFALRTLIIDVLLSHLLIFHLALFHLILLFLLNALCVFRYCCLQFRRFSFPFLLIFYGFLPWEFSFHIRRNFSHECGFESECTTYLILPVFCEE